MTTVREFFESSLGGAKKLQRVIHELTEEWYENDPSFTLMVGEPNTNFTEHNNVSFRINRTESWISFTVIMYGPHSIFTFHNLGNLSGVGRAIFYSGVKFGATMPGRNYAVTFRTYDPFEADTTTTEENTETTTESTTTEQTTTWDENTLLESLRRNSILVIILGSGILAVIVVYIKKTRKLLSRLLFSIRVEVAASTCLNGYHT